MYAINAIPPTRDTIALRMARRMEWTHIIPLRPHTPTPPIILYLPTNCPIQRSRSFVREPPTPPMRTMQLYLPQRYPPMQLYRQALNKLIRPEFGVSDGVGLVQTAYFIHTISHSIWVRPPANSRISIKTTIFLSLNASVLTFEPFGLRMIP